MYDAVLVELSSPAGSPAAAAGLHLGRARGRTGRRTGWAKGPPGRPGSVTLDLIHHPTAQSAAMEQTPAHGPRATRQWIGRAAFEAALIVMGIVGALVVDEWRDARDRAARVQEALTAIRAELQANLTSVREVLALNEELIATLRESAKTGAVYQGGIVRSRPLSTVAWEAARDGAITTDIDHQTLMRLGRAYGATTRYLAEVSGYASFTYTYDGPTSLRERPERLAGWLSDLASRARGVEQQIGEALDAMDGDAGRPAA